jgi:hypothetical protein
METNIINVDQDGMEYFGMFTEIDGKIVYMTSDSKERWYGNNKY